MRPFNRQEYELWLYTLPQSYPQITASTLRLYSNSATSGIVRGSLHLQNGLKIRVFEYLDLSDGELFEYSYTVYSGETKIRWYDPQPHPENLALAPTFPHHYHEEPDIKHHRLPAPGIRFYVPNLAQIITDALTIKSL